MQARARTAEGAPLLRPRTDSTNASELSRESVSRSTREEARQRNRATQRLLCEWLEDDSGYDEQTWPQLRKALEENRSAAAEGSLFRD